MVTGIEIVFVTLGSEFLCVLHVIKSRLQLFLLKPLSKYFILSFKLSGVLQTSCARLVKVRLLVAL